MYTWTPSEGTVLLSTTSHENQRGRVYGDRVVWYGYVGSDLGNGEIFTWTPTTGLVQITKNSGDDQTPEVYGDRVVWAGHDTNSIYQIYTWTPSGGTKKISSETSNPAYPVVSGDRISWCGDRTTVVKTWTAATGIVNVSELEDAGYKHGLKASGDRLVWTSDNGVFTWTPADGIVRITPDAADAQVSGDRVVWSIWSGLNFQVFTWTPTGGVIQLSAGGDGGQAPQVSGDFVVWVSYPASGAVIRGWTPTGGMIEVGASQCVPAVSGTAWRGPPGNSADSDVYTAIVRPISSAAVSGNSPATGPTIGGTTVVITGSGFSALSGASAASKSSAASGCPDRCNGFGGLLRGRSRSQLHHRLRQADHRGRSPARGGQGGRLRGDEHRSFRHGGQRQRLHLRSCQPHPDREHRLSPPLLRHVGVEHDPCRRLLRRKLLVLAVRRRLRDGFL